MGSNEVPPTDDFRAFNLRAARSDEYAALNAFKNVQRREIVPEDPPVPYDEDVGRWQAMPTFVEQAAWALWDRSQMSILTFAEARVHHTGDNPDLMEFAIEVLPDFRRQGLARRSLRLIAANARDHSRHLLMAECNDRVPAGAEFLRRIGASKGLEEPVNQLRLVDLDRNLVRRWLEGSRLLAQDFALSLCDEGYPRERLAELAALLQVAANDQPRDALMMEDMNFTPETIQQWDEFERAAGQQHWIMYVLDRRHGRIVGFTEVTWSPSRPVIVDQGFTGVLPEYRHKGLGRWLKAAMLDKILSEHPEVQEIRAGNASSNAPMLKINRALGFRTLVSWSTWQVALDSVEEYLAERG
jgi:mycothiol synthase